MALLKTADGAREPDLGEELEQPAKVVVADANPGVPDRKVDGETLGGVLWQHLLSAACSMRVRSLGSSIARGGGAAERLLVIVSAAVVILRHELTLSSAVLGLICNLCCSQLTGWIWMPKGDPHRRPPMTW